MKILNIDIIAGARPNFIKIAPILEEIDIFNSDNKKIQYRLIHTGQHYDKNMSADFFNQLEIPKPHFNLKSGSGNQSEQTAKIMIGYENLLKDVLPDLVLVVGDVTSTMACSIVAKKSNIKVAHVEAGIRSFDLSMPEEINRIVTDSLSDYFFTTSDFANQNLLNNGVSKSKIFFVGNTMIDTLKKFRTKFITPRIWEEKNLSKKNYLVLTLHRPSNVDDLNNLTNILNEISKNVNDLPIIFPAHPRTKKNLESIKINFKNILLLNPMSYLEFNFLVENSMAVITDSGGITEETTFMKIPCITLRDNTERPETINLGTNILIGSDVKNIKPALYKLFNGNWKNGSTPPLWDGNTSKRIIKYLAKVFELN